MQIIEELEAERDVAYTAEEFLLRPDFAGNTRIPASRSGHC